MVLNRPELPKRKTPKKPKNKTKVVCNDNVRYNYLLNFGAKISRLLLCVLKKTSTWRHMSIQTLLPTVKPAVLSDLLDILLEARDNNDENSKGTIFAKSGECITKWKRSFVERVPPFRPSSDLFCYIGAHESGMLRNLRLLPYIFGDIYYR